MSEPGPGALAPGACIGILGGGQLGRMLAVAAARLGYVTHVYEPGEDPPAAHVATRVTRAGWDDEAALAAFGTDADVITYEFENIPAAALDLLEGLAPIRPGRTALVTSADRLDEKTFLRRLGLATAPFANVDDSAALEAGLARLGTPAILKTRRLGYDGKGQVRIDSLDAAGAAFEQLAGAPAILEGFVAFEREISVIGARGLDGVVACFDPGENLHDEGILRRTTVPAAIRSSRRTDAVLATGRILSALDYVGVMGVEFFDTPSGLVVNEIAPRVHNSGHWTQQGCTVDQFEQHIRAIAGLPLSDARRFADVEMTNLIGEEAAPERLDTILRDPFAALHLYGKAEARPGRKMGHVNRIIAPGDG